MFPQDPKPKSLVEASVSCFIRMRDSDRHWLKQMVLSPVASHDLRNFSNATIFVLGSRSMLACFQISTSLGSNSSLPSSFVFCSPLFFGPSSCRQSATGKGVEGQTGRCRETARHLEPIVLELHRFQSLHCLLAATLLALLAATLLQEFLEFWELVILAIGQLHYVHGGSRWMGRRSHSVVILDIFNSLVCEVSVPDGFRGGFEHG